MKLQHRFLALLIILSQQALNAQDIYQAYRQSWLQKAESNKPELITTVKHPRSLIRLVKDTAAFQGWCIESAALIDSLYTTSFNRRKEVILDFGEHLTGYFSFSLDTLRRTPDAPLRFKLTFGEVPSEIATPFDPYPGGLSRAWLQDEMITVMDVPSVVTINRRLAFRYVKIELLGSSPYFEFKLNNAHCKAVSSVTEYPSPLQATVPQIIKDIDRVGLNTLKECMQTVYEDGPKRDQRLWIGDLYLESLANNYSFKNYALTKRCLYLLAGLSHENGYLIGTVFERPTPHPQAAQFLMDYALLYNVALRDYVEATGDKETGLDLWPVVKKQLDIVHSYLLPDGMMNYEKANKEWWLFFDWKNGLHKEAALQGLSIYVLKQVYELSKLLNKQEEVKELPALIKKMNTAARSKLYNKKTGLIESGAEKQLSYASQIWMVLSGVLSKTESQKALRGVINSKDAVYPGAPYLYHYFIQALLDAGMPQEARASLEHYWGGMVRKGADTFWEVYDPADEYLSPYNFFPVNSYCHAWSCTPVYFIRKYPEVFQR